MIRNINEAYGDPELFESVEAMEQAVSELDEHMPGEGYWPEDGLVEGRDYEVVCETRFIAWTGQDPDEEFRTRAQAEAFMRSEGLEPTGESASDGETECGRVTWQGECEFWAEPGRSLDSYGDGYEPRIRILHSRGNEEDDGE